jgi:hypothetical protein
MGPASARARRLFVALLIFWAGSANAYWIGLAPATSTHSLGSTFAIDLVLSGLKTDGQIVSVYDLTVGFDPSVIQFFSAQPGNALGAGPLFDIITGMGFVNLFSLSSLLDAELAAFQGDSLTLATLSFVGTGVGTSSLTLLPVALGGASFGSVTTDLLALPHEVGSATVTIVASAPEPSTLLLLALALPLLAARIARQRR